MRQPAEGAALDSLEPAAGRPAYSGFDRLLYSRLYPGAFHALFYAALVILIYFSFAPGQKGEGNLATEVVWKLWWPGLPFLLLAANRIWCGVCPFGGISDLAGRLRKTHATSPKALRRGGPWLGALSVFGFGLAFLALGLEMNAGATGVILIGMTVLAFGLSIFYRGRSFCRYICPVGMITRVYSFFSWLRPYGSHRKGIGLAACPVGQSPESLRQPSQCQLCGTCTDAAGAGGITTSAGFAAVRVPGNIEFGRAEAALSLLLLGLMAADSVRMTSLFARFQQAALPYFDYNYRLTVVAGVTGLVGIVLGLQLLIAWAGSRRGAGSAFDGIAFSYLPLTLGVFLALALQHLWSGAWPSLQTVLVEARLIDWAGHMPPKNVYFTSIPLKAIQFVLLGAGLRFSWKIARRGLMWSDVPAEAAHSRIDFEAEGAGALSRRLMVLSAFAGFGFLFLLPMSGAC